MVNKETLNSIKYFRNTSFFYYLFSMTLIIVFLSLSLVASKNNRSCQYGSTLFCRSETYFNEAFGNDDEYFTLTYTPYSGLAGNNIIKYPLGDDYITIDYHFIETIPSGYKKYGNSSIGLSTVSSGGSIYFNTNSVASAENITIFTNLIFENFSQNIDIISKNKTTLKYIPESTESIQPTSNSFFSSSNNNLNQTSYPKNWLSLLQELKSQHVNGCKKTANHCACIDPNFISGKTCSDYHFNKSNGLYCPKDKPNCDTPCTGSNDTTDCGYRFCSHQPKPSTTGLKTIPPNGSSNEGYYQNNFISGIKKPNTSNIYKLGKNTLFINDEFLEDIDSSNFNAADDLAKYPSYQYNSFCGGTDSSNSNYHDSSNSTATKPFTTETTDNYTPQYSTDPNTIANKNNYDF